MPDRYANAVRARRAELRAERELLGGGHRGELRTALALSRVLAGAESAIAVAELRRQVGVHLDRTDRAGRRRTPELLAAALDETARVLHSSWAAALRPALLRIATERALPLGADWPRLPSYRSLPAPAAPPDTSSRHRLPGVAHGMAHGLTLWRLLVIPLAVLPMWGLPALGGVTLAPLAAGGGLAALLLAAHAGVAAAERAQLRRHAEAVLGAAAVAMEADLGRRLLELERTAAAVLDAAVARRRAAVDAGLGELAAQVRGG
jgi:hypothetical protein